MSRRCDHSTCQLLAITIGTYTNDLKEGTTRAACTEEHRLELHAELQARGFTPKWLPFTQPEAAPPLAEPRPPAPSVCQQGEVHAP